MLTVTSSGTRDEAEVFKMLQGSTKVTGIEVHHNSVVPQNELDEQFRFDGALLFKNLISNLPRLEFLAFHFDWHLPGDTMIPVDIVEFDSFPDVASLTLDHWPFGHFVPNPLQSRFRPAVLQKLSLFNSFDIDNLFEILVRNDTQLKLLVVKYVGRPSNSPPLQTIDAWPELTTFLLQQRSIEELGLNECEMRKDPIVRYALENGASLKSLDIHFHERPWLCNVQHRHTAPSLDYQFLEGIRTGCGALEKLEIDMPLEELIAVSPTPPHICGSQVHIQRKTHRFAYRVQVCNGLENSTVGNTGFHLV